MPVSTLNSSARNALETAFDGLGSLLEEEYLLLEPGMHELSVVDATVEGNHSVALGALAQGSFKVHDLPNYRYTMVSTITPTLITIQARGPTKLRAKEVLNHPFAGRYMRIPWKGSVVDAQGRQSGTVHSVRTATSPRVVTPAPDGNVLYGIPTRIENVASGDLASPFALNQPATTVPVGAPLALPLVASSAPFRLGMTIIGLGYGPYPAYTLYFTSALGTTVGFVVTLDRCADSYLTLEVAGITEVSSLTITAMYDALEFRSCVIQRFATGAVVGGDK